MRCLRKYNFKVRSQQIDQSTAAGSASAPHFNAHTESKVSSQFDFRETMPHQCQSEGDRSRALQLARYQNQPYAPLD